MIRLLVESIVVNLWDFGWSNYFLDVTPKAQAKRKLDFIKTKNFCVSKDSIKRVKKNLEIGRIYLQIMYQKGHNIQNIYIKKSYDSTIKRKISQFKNRWRIWKVGAPNIQVANKYVKRWSTSLVIREMRYHFTLSRRARIFLKKENNKCPQRQRNRNPNTLLVGM